jgi:hypothetical protein
MKEAYIFDMDDTLIASNSHIYVYNHQNELIDKINSRSYVNKRNQVKEYYQSGYRVNTDEFGGIGNCEVADMLSYHHLYHGETLKEQIEILQNIVLRAKEERVVDLYFVTGRANKPETLQKLIQERFDISIPTSHIYQVINQECMKKLEEQEDGRARSILYNGKSDTNFKKRSFYDILQIEYDYIEFYDDDPDNILCFENVVKSYQEIENKRIEYKTFWIQEKL